MVTIEIDGKQIQAENGSMLIEAADNAGIHIPRFCYHKKLSVAANCRMCLVEVEKVGKPLPACATPVADGMKVFTRSALALDAQKGTMEFLLINHPLDCPICDQGGECTLQEMAMGYGDDVSRYHEGKRVVRDKNVGPLIQTELTRCIHCTRCIRFGDEIAGIRELGATGRGEHMEIGTYIEKSVDSEVSGNVIDLCPVGALTSKPFRYSARPWELSASAAIAPHDAVGSNIYIHSRRNRVMRVVPRDNDAINECWIADRDRFSYEAVNSYERLTVPMIRRGGHWQESDWSSALDAVSTGLKKVIGAHGATELGALISPLATLEEMYLCQKLIRQLGSSNIDHRLRQSDFRDDAGAPLYPSLGQAIDDLERLDAALIIGSNIRKALPIAALRLRKAARRGARLMFVNPLAYEFNFPVYEHAAVDPAGMPLFLAGLAKALVSMTGRQVPPACTTLLKAIEPNDACVVMAEALCAADRPAVVLGELAQYHSDFSVLRALAGVVANLSGAVFSIFPETGNSAGGWIAGALPHRTAGGQAGGSTGLNARQMCETGLRAFIVHGIDIEYDCACPGRAEQALAAAEFTVFVGPFRSALMERHADVLLPCGPFTETSGTFVNAAGQWQSFTGSVAPLAGARPAWKIYRVMGNLLKLDGFDYVSSDEVRDEIRQIVGDARPDNAAGWQFPAALGAAAPGGRWQRVVDVPIYAADPLVRRAASLQETVDAKSAAAHINSSDAAELNLQENMEMVIGQEGGDSLNLPLVIDERVPSGCVYIPAAVPGTQGFVAMTGHIEISQAQQAEKAG